MTKVSNTDYSLIGIPLARKALVWYVRQAVFDTFEDLTVPDRLGWHANPRL
jgi:hypothetical protein